MEFCKHESRVVLVKRTRLYVGGSDGSAVFFVTQLHEKYANVTDCTAQLGLQPGA